MNNEDKIQQHEALIEQHKAWIKQTQASMDRHLEIYANNGKEMARLATNVENLIKTVDSIKIVITSGDKQAGEQGIDVASIKSDVDWLKRNHWAVKGALVSGFLSLVISIILIAINFLVK